MDQVDMLNDAQKEIFRSNLLILQKLGIASSDGEAKVRVDHGDAVADDMGHVSNYETANSAFMSILETIPGVQISNGRESKNATTLNLSNRSIVADLITSPEGNVSAYLQFPDVQNDKIKIAFRSRSSMGGQNVEVELSFDDNLKLRNTSVTFSTREDDKFSDTNQLKFHTNGESRVSIISVDDKKGLKPGEEINIAKLLNSVTRRPNSDSVIDIKEYVD
jgi:hypothetical protein